MCGNHHADVVKFKIPPPRPACLSDYPLGPQTKRTSALASRAPGIQPALTDLRYMQDCFLRQGFLSWDNLGGLLRTGFHLSQKLLVLTSSNGSKTTESQPPPTFLLALLCLCPRVVVSLASGMAHGQPVDTGICSLSQQCVWGLASAAWSSLADCGSLCVAGWPAGVCITNPASKNLTAPHLARIGCPLLWG